MVLLLVVPKQEDQARGGCDDRKLQEDAASPILPAGAPATASITAAHCFCDAISIVPVRGGKGGRGGRS